jgi:hypothetical protein
MTLRPLAGALVLAVAAALLVMPARAEETFWSASTGLPPKKAHPTASPYYPIDVYYGYPCGGAYPYGATAYGNGATRSGSSTNGSSHGGRYSCSGYRPANGSRPGNGTKPSKPAPAPLPARPPKHS